MRVFKIVDPVFKTEPLFILGCSHKTLGRYIKRWHLDPGLDDGQCGQMFTFKQAPWRIVWTKDLPRNSESLGVLLHEIFHLVTRICQDKGIPIKAQIEEGSGDEPAAYLFELLAKTAVLKSGMIRK